MKKKWLAIGIILLFVGTCVIPATAQDIEKPLPSSRGSWLYVGGSGLENYTTIQSAVDAANPGDTVYVYDDMSPYSEFIFISKSIHLIGEDKNTTIIEGIDDEMAGAIQISGTFFTRIQSFTIININTWDDGIYSSSNFYLIVTDVNIISNGDGIFFDVGSHNTIISSTLTSKSASGIAIHLSSRNTITNCNIMNNGHYGIFLQESSNNKIYHNNFINNTHHVFLYECDTNLWDNGYPSGGNYWDDYNGVDANGDGIGDTPYNISNGLNQDHYPFMKPNGWLNQPPVVAVFIGLISDLNDTGGEVISFKAKFVYYAKFDPFEIRRVIPDEEIWVSRDYQGYLGPKFILGIFTVVATEFP